MHDHPARVDSARISCDFVRVLDVPLLLLGTSSSLPPPPTLAPAPTPPAGAADQHQRWWRVCTLAEIAFAPLPVKTGAQRRGVQTLKTDRLRELLFCLEGEGCRADESRKYWPS